MTLLFSIHTLNLVFFQKASGGGAGHPPLKGQEGALTHRIPPDLGLTVGGRIEGVKSAIGNQALDFKSFQLRPF